MFNSPIEYCPHCRQYVALDQTQQQCAAEYQCQIELCPLHKYFTGELGKAGSPGASDLQRPMGREIDARHKALDPEGKQYVHVDLEV